MSHVELLAAPDVSAIADHDFSPMGEAAVDFGWSLQDVFDVLTFAQSMPTEAPLPLARIDAP